MVFMIKVCCCYKDSTFQPASAMLLAWLLLVWTLGAAAAPQKRPHKPSPEVAAMSAADAQCAYRLIETRCPYPDAAMSRAAPLCLGVVCGIGTGDLFEFSVCVYT